MLNYLARRFVYMVVVLCFMSIVSFMLIQLPPGDYVNSYVMTIAESGERVTQAEVEALREQYGLNKPMILQYFIWMRNMLRGNMGMSFIFQRPVSALIAERLPMTIIVSLATLLFTYLLAIPIGIYSATHQYSIGDYVATFFGFIGLAVPNFLLAIILMLFFNKTFGTSVGGLFSMEFQMAPWSVAKVLDLLKHLPIPIIVIGLSGTASIIRTLRGCLLDELQKQYVVTARAKGVSETTLLLRYPVRVAANPLVSSVAWLLPSILSGETIAAIVLGLPTVGPLLLQALLEQDTYLAGAVVMLLCVLTVLGTLLSDILLVAFDPRIKFGDV